MEKNLQQPTPHGMGIVAGDNLGAKMGYMQGKDVDLLLQNQTFPRIDAGRSLFQLLLPQTTVSKIDSALVNSFRLRRALSTSN